MKIANIMDSSLEDIRKKGVFSMIPKVYNPNNHFDKVVHFSPHKKDLLAEVELRESNIEVFCYEKNSIWPLKFLLEQFSYIRKFYKEKFTLVRGRLPYLGSLYGLIAAKLFRIPFVVSLGGDNRISQEKTGVYHYNSKFISYKMEKLVLKYSDSVVCPNEFTRRYVVNIIGDKYKNKLAVIPWLSEGINLSESSVDIYSKYSIPEDALIFPVIGFLNRYKYTDVIFDVVSSIKEEYPNHFNKIYFVFCGDGPLLKEGKERFNDLNNVLFLGWSSSEVVQTFIRKAYCVLIPMSGFVLLEAASIGRPIITSKIEWHTELVKDMQSGYIVDPDLPSEWVKSIKHAIDNPRLLERMGAEIKKTYSVSYSYAATVEKEYNLYRSLVKKGIDI